MLQCSNVREIDQVNSSNGRKMLKKDKQTMLLIKKYTIPYEGCGKSISFDHNNDQNIARD